MDSAEQRHDAEKPTAPCRQSREHDLDDVLGAINYDDGRSSPVPVN
jgi:hypothetical protein